ncbi:ABC transporter permease [Exiguobacterium sp. RIT452]|jgi:cell division transport system permease protein|uniref:permease-like cell division protein FtsX n=1 Tax=Exiguobacterium TaxID=33986 RepID=UPI00047DCEEA|nr:MULTISPECIES: permease-like cell division protein FtsX [Exiguobacterium]RJO98316.1 ABC transporter permease [Exiguobacterium sp. RIT452]
MKFNGFRHLREGAKGLVRNGWMTFASVSAVTVTLLLVGIFAMVMFNVNKISDNVEKDVEIQVFVERESDQAKIDSVGEKLKQMPGVESVRYSSKEEELDRFKEQLGEGSQAYQSVEKDNPLHDRYIVKATSPNETETIANTVKKMENIDSVEYGEDYVEKMFNFLEGVRIGGIILIVGLTFMAMFLISNTIKVTIFSRRREIEIMRLVGAKNGFIRAPFFIEGLLMGVLGALIPIAVVYFGYEVTYNALQPQLVSLNASIFTLIPPGELSVQVALILLALGAFIGVWGSTTSLGRFLKI